jgi:hemolysin activation/secretion protein
VNGLQAMGHGSVGLMINRISRHSARGALVAGLLLGVAADPAPAQESPPEVVFDVWEIAVTGNTRLDAREIEKTVYPFLGPKRTVADIEKARQALEVRFRDAGYGTVVVNIPEQDVEQGQVTLNVIEGGIDRLLVTGARYYSPERIKALTPSLAPGSVPALPELQRELIALNAVTPDRRITPVLRPGRSPGTLEAELKVEDRLPLHGSLELNNRQVRDTEPLRLTATLTYANLWQKEHSLTVGYQTAPEDRENIEVLFGTYTARIPDSQWLASGYYVNSDTNVVSLGTLGVVGTGQIAGLRAIRTLPSLAGGLQRATFGIDYKDFDESVALTGNQPTIETPINYGVLSAGWALLFLGEGRTTDINVQGTVGPRFLGNQADEFNAKRTGSKPNFAYLNFGISHQQPLPRDFGLRATLTAQLAGSSLINLEQFNFGGYTTVRGYFESQAFVDDGYNAQLELLTPNWGQGLPGVDSGRLLVFVDAGGGRLQDALQEQDDRYFLWSAGLGLRATVLTRMTAALEWAYPLRDSLDDSVQSGDDRWLFLTRYDF